MEEYQSIMENNVWEIVSRSERKSVVTSKCVYKIKHAVDGSIDKYKERFVAKGFSQQEGEDYDETFSVVARYTSIRAIISLATSMGWSLHQMDVKTAFLNGVIEEEVYIEKPQGFEVHPRETHVCRLKKALYGLKQAPRAWYARIDSYLTRQLIAGLSTSVGTIILLGCMSGLEDGPCSSLRGFQHLLGQSFFLCHRD
jgi:hypothetical protein